MIILGAVFIAICLGFIAWIANTMRGMGKVKMYGAIIGECFLIMLWLGAIGFIIYGMAMSV